MASVGEEKDLYLDKVAVKKLFELILSEIKTTIPGIVTEMPMTENAANASDVKDKVPTVLAVFNALKSIDHIKFRMIKGEPGQSLEDAMGETSPEEVALYFYRTTDSADFELFIYDSSQGKYFKVGGSTITAGDLNLDEYYWRKDALDITAYWSKTELKLEDLVTKEELEKYLTAEDLEGYLKKEDIGTMTPEDVVQIFNETKAELAK